MNPIHWHASYKTCSHSNEDVCPTCDFDDYYARTYADCPWRAEVLDRDAAEFARAEGFA